MEKRTLGDLWSVFRLLKPKYIKRPEENQGPTRVIQDRSGGVLVVDDDVVALLVEDRAEDHRTHERPLPHVRREERALAALWLHKSNLFHVSRPRDTGRPATSSTALRP